jgi:opacity protein-like surface antigen
MKKIFAALLLGCCAMSAHAKGNYIGVGVSSIRYPNWVDEANTSALSAGFSSANTQQNAGSFGFEIYSGQWFSDNIGYEIGYANLGSITGNSTLTGPSATYNYKYSASAFHVSALGGVLVGKHRIFGKVGIFNASTKLAENGAISGSTISASFSESSGGLVVGAGFADAITENLFTKLEFDVYNGVKFANDFTPTKTVDSKNLMKLTFGLGYQF